MKIRKIRAIRYVARVFLLALLILGPLGIISFGGVFPCVFTIFNTDLSCPLGWAQRALTTMSLQTYLLIASIFFIIATMLFGRFFCSWLCPVGLITETINVFKGRKLGPTETQRREKSEKADMNALMGRRRLMRYFKYSFLAAVLISSALIRYPVFCLICPVGILCRNVLGISIGYGWTIELIIIPFAIFLFEVFLTDRAWCGSLCPMGALFSLLGSLPTKIYKLRVEKTPVCEKCRGCWSKCPMGIAPPINELPDECSNCGLCTEVCRRHQHLR